VVYWITDEGVDRLTELIDKYTLTEDTMSEGLARQQRLLEILEYMGEGSTGGHTFEQVVEVLRGQRFPIEGTDKQWKKALDSLVRNGYVEESS